MSHRVMLVCCLCLIFQQQASFGGSKDRPLAAQQTLISDLEKRNEKLSEELAIITGELEKQKRLSEYQSQTIQLLGVKGRDCEMKLENELQRHRQETAGPGSEKIFKAQVLLESAFGVTVSPHSDNSGAWEPFADWVTQNQSTALYVLVHITPELLRVAVDQWKSKGGASHARQRSVLEDLKKRYIHPGERTFLLVIKPVEATDYITEWGLVLGNLKAKTTRLAAINGSTGLVTRSEDCGLDELLVSGSGTASCLFFMQDVVNRETDPTFIVAIGGVSHRMKLNSGPWARAREEQTVRFRFEPSSVKLVQLLEEGIPWATIEERYLGPRQAARDRMSGRVGELLLGVASDILLKLLF